MRELQHGSGVVREGERGPKVERERGIDERRLEKKKSLADKNPNLRH